MKKAIILLLVGLASTTLSLTVQGQTAKTIQTVSSNATVSATADVVIVTGTNAVTLTLPSATTGRTLVIVNHSSEELTLSSAVRVGNTQTTSLLPNYVASMEPTLPSNRVTIIYDGSEWRLID